MIPKTRSSPRGEVKESNKKGPKKKRQPSECENDEISKKKSPNPKKKPKVVKESKKKGLKRKRQTSESESVEVSEKNEDSDEKQNEGANEETEYGKFEKFNKDKLWKLKKIAHHLLPSFNILKNNDLKEARVFPLVQISLPHSVYVNSKFPETIDFCHRRTIALNSYMSRLKGVRTAYLSAKKRNKAIRKDEKKGIYCKALIDFAERREFHPDKYFMQDYDYYYTGGNLCINSRSSQVVHVAGTEMNTLVLNVHHNIPKVHKLTSVEFKNAAKDDCEIFEVQSSFADDDYIFMRQKHCVSIHEFRNGKLNLLQNFKTKDVPFISFTQDPVNTHHLTISDLAHKVRVCDLEKGIPTQTFKMMPKNQITTANNWNMIKSLDSHVYLYSACKKVSIIDTRLPESEWKSNYCGITEETSCYNICSLARSKFEHLFYVGTNHKAYCVDRRYMDKDIDSKHAAVACWTHQMSTFPLMMATTCQNNSEYIALQSPLSSDMRICENMQYLQESESESSTETIKKPRMDLPLEYFYKSPCLPYMPPSIETVFQEARLQGKCIKQGTGIGERVKACITGLDFYDDGSTQYLFTATSNGDIFARKMHNPDNVDVKPDTFTAADVMTEFEDNIFRTVRKTPLQTTEVCNLAGVSKVFRCPLLSGTKYGDDFDFASKRKYMGRWQKSIHSLSKYKDALAYDLLAIWNFDIDEGKDFNITALSKTEVGDKKVSGWLQNTPDVTHSTTLNMTSIPLDVLHSTMANTSFNENEETNDKSQLDLEQSIPVKPKTAKKKPRYIKGF